MLTYLAPSLPWEFSMILLTLNVKRAPDMTTLFGLDIFLFQKVNISDIYIIEYILFQKVNIYIIELI